MTTTMIWLMRRLCVRCEASLLSLGQSTIRVIQAGQLLGTQAVHLGEAGHCSPGAGAGAAATGMRRPARLPGTEAAVHLGAQKLGCRPRDIR